MDKDLTALVGWAQSQGWQVQWDRKGYTRFYDPEGRYVASYPATPSNPWRRAARAAQEGRAAVMDEPTRDWAVTLTYAAAPEEQDLLWVEEVLETWSAAVTGAPPDRVMVTLHVPADDPLVAVEAARGLLRRARVTWLQVGVEAVSEEEYERRAEASTLPELVGASEVGAMLGVSRQRVHQLRNQPSFPAPLVEVAMGPLWDARAIEAFARTWSRRPGRPPLAVASG